MEFGVLKSGQGIGNDVVDAWNVRVKLQIRIWTVILRTRSIIFVQDVNN